eukprot:142227_1
MKNKKQYQKLQDESTNKQELDTKHITNSALLTVRTDNENEYDTASFDIKEEQEVIQYYKSLNKHALSQLTTKTEYKYVSDFDKNGVIYAIGIGFDVTGKTKWVNPGRPSSNRCNRVILTSYPNELCNGAVLSDIIGR